MPNTMLIKTIKGIEKYLNPKALNITNTPLTNMVKVKGVDTVIVKVTDGALVAIQDFGVKVPCEDSAIPVKYTQRFAMVINDLADRHFIKYGCLMKPIYTELESKKALLMFYACSEYSKTILNPFLKLWGVSIIENGEIPNNEWLD